MASTYSTNLKLELIGTGEQSGVWGTTTNTNMGTAIEQAIVGKGSPVFSTDADLTLTLSNSSAAQTARAFVLNVTSGVSLTATRNLVVPTIEKPYVVMNNTTGGQSIVVKTTSGSGITVPNGGQVFLYVDGTNVIQMLDAFGDLTYTGTLTGGTGVVNLGSGQLYKAADGKVGLGNTSPGATLDVNGEIRSRTADGFVINHGTKLGSFSYAGGLLIDRVAGSSLLFAQNGSIQAKIDSAGNLGLDVTPNGGWTSGVKAFQFSPYGAMWTQGNGNTNLAFNVYESAGNTFSYLTSDEACMFTATKDGTFEWKTAAAGTAGNPISFTTAMTLAASSVLTIENSNGQLVAGQLDASTAFIQSKTSGGSARAIAFMGASEYGRFDASGNLTPGGDNTQTNGSGAKRWSVIYAGTGTINTSDAREKTDVRVMAADEIEAAKALSKEIGVYQFLDSVAAKGDKARHHIGMTVQRAIEIMKHHGLDPFSYGFICYDKWGEETKEHPAVEAREAVEAKDAVLDDEGNVIEPAVEAQPAIEGKDAWIEVTLKAGDRYSFRYDQLTLFIARGIDARLAALEAAT